MFIILLACNMIKKEPQSKITTTSSTGNFIYLDC